MYSVIETINKNDQKEVSIVLQKWVVGKTVRWPKINEYNAAIKKKMDYEPSWQIFQAKILKDDIETLKLARQFQKFYEINTDSGGEPVDFKSKRKVISHDFNSEFKKLKNDAHDNSKYPKEESVEAGSRKSVKVSATKSIKSAATETTAVKQSTINLKKLSQSAKQTVVTSSDTEYNLSATSVPYETSLPPSATPPATSVTPPAPTVTPPAPTVTPPAATVTLSTSSPSLNSASTTSAFPTNPSKNCNNYNRYDSEESDYTPPSSPQPESVIFTERNLESILGIEFTKKTANNKDDVLIEIYNICKKQFDNLSQRIEVIENRLHVLNTNVTELVALLKQNNNTSTIIKDDSFCCPLLPISSLEMFVQFNNQLNRDDFCNQMVVRLHLLTKNKSSTNEAVRAVLEKIMTKDIAKLHSWTGKSLLNESTPSKKSFASYLGVLRLLQSCLQYSSNKTTTEEEIAASVKEFLKRLKRRLAQS